METIQDRINNLKNLFARFHSKEEIYNYILQLAKESTTFPEEEKKEKNRVTSCQSILYITTQQKDGKLYFQFYSDALISKGLAALLLQIYRGATLQELLTHKPTEFLTSIPLFDSLSPARALGLSGIYPLIVKQSLQAVQLKS